MTRFQLQNDLTIHRDGKALVSLHRCLNHTARENPAGFSLPEFKAFAESMVRMLNVPPDTTDALRDIVEAATLLIDCDARGSPYDGFNTLLADLRQKLERYTRITAT